MGDVVKRWRAVLQAKRGYRPGQGYIAPDELSVRAGHCRRWLGGIFEAREKAVKNYARALEDRPLSPEARAQAITNYDKALRERFG